MVEKKLRKRKETKKREKTTPIITTTAEAEANYNRNCITSSLTSE